MTNLIDYDGLRQCLIQVARLIPEVMNETNALKYFKNES